MKAAIIENGLVTNIIVVDSLNALPNLIDAGNAGNAGIGDSWDGVAFSKPLPNPITLSEIESALMQHISTAAERFNYDDINEVGVYASTSNIYQLEAQRIVSWAANCWQMFYALIDPVSTTTTIDDFLTSLPSMES